MKQNFNDCVNRVLKDEGGYSNDPNDSGGPTNRGITLSDLRRYKRNATVQDIENLSVDEAKSIYKQCYWDSLSCDDLSSGVDYTCFDYGVNSGVGKPRKLLKKFSNMSGKSLIDAINNERVSFLKSLAAKRSKDEKFLIGWLNRVERVRTISKQMAGKNFTVGPTVGSGTVIAGIGLSQYLHQYQWVIVSGAIGAAVIVGLIIHYIVNKGK